MPIDGRPRRLRRLLVLLAAIGLLLAACGNSTEDSGGSGTTGGGGDNSSPGVTADEIRFSVLATKSNNPLGTCILDCYVDGIKAYFAFRNSEGGVHGRKLVVTQEIDDELANNQAKALEIVSADDTFATFGASQVASGWADLAKAGIPLYVWGLDTSAQAGQESIFSYREVVCITCSKRPEAYVAKLAKAKRVASLGFGVSEASKQCADSTKDTIDRYSDDVGGPKHVYLNDDLAFGLPNGIGPEVTAMKKAGVDMIVACVDLNAAKTIAQELERQGIRDEVTMMHPNLYDQAFVKAAGDLFEGDYIQAAFRPFEADPGDSALADYLKWMDETGSELTELAMVGWINASQAYEGIKAAGPDFTRESVIAATNKMTAFTAGGLVQPIDWTRQHEPATEEDPATHGPNPDCAPLVQVKDGEFEVVGDPAKPFTCWPGDTRDWSEPEPTDFE